MRIVLAVIVLLGWASTAGAVSLDQLLRKPEYGLMSLSPTGEYVGVTVPLDDRTLLAILRMSDMQVTATVDPGKNGFVDDAVWVSDRRMMAQWSMRWGMRAQPYGGWSLYALDVDGRNRSHFNGSIVDALPAEPEHVLVGTCSKVVRNRCEMRLEKMRIDGRGKTETIAVSPLPDGRFATDRKGMPRFSWSWDDQDLQKVSIRRNDAWVELNDEATSGVEVTPLGISYDLRYGFLRSERQRGPDVIERIDLASGERTVVAADPVRDPAAVVWSLDRSEPIGVTYGAARPTLTFFDNDHPHARLLAELQAAFPQESPRVTSASRDGRRAIVEVVSDREPGRYYLLETATGDLRLLARARSWLDPAAMAATAHTVVVARDGIPLDTYLTRPASHAAAPAPLVVLVHGGPYGMRDGWEFEDEVQLLAGQGYAVLRVNFRGSGGRGRAFMEQGYRQWGRAMQNDVTDATRWALAQPGIDPRRACIWGASYGAYAAVMGVVREPGLYRCAVGAAGPYDLPTMFRWGDIQRSDWGKGQLRQFLGDDPKEHLQWSPTRLAQQVDAPLLLVQGGRDPRVSPEHARAMVRALESAGKPHETYFPPSEGHGFYADKSRKEYYARVIDFLRRHLQAGAEPPRG